MIKETSHKCKWCDKLIPKNRKKTAHYCSNECYYEAKKLRSTITYHSQTAPAKGIRKNEEILSAFYLLVELKKEFCYDDLEKKNFDFGLSEGQTVGPNNEIGTIIGKFAYYINPNTQKVTLWKLKNV